jgi:hypothetical protein
MSLLQLIQGVCNSPGIGIPAPSAVVNSTDRAIKELLELAQQEGRELADRAAWQAITTEKTFTSVAAETQTSAIPSDFNWMVPDTFFNRTKTRRFIGPLTPQQWQTQKAQSVSTVTDYYRIRGNNILVIPTMAAGDTCAYEYVSLNFCESSGGTDQSAWAADTDVGLLDEKLMKLGIIWRYKKGKGLDYAEDFQTYEVKVTQAIARDGARTKLDFANGMMDLRPGIGIPDGSWSL